MPTFGENPLAIIGMACKLPGANDLEEFWHLLIEGRCAISEAPLDRLRRDLYYDSEAPEPFKTYIASGGLVQYQPFDPRVCPVPRSTLPHAEVGHQAICQVASQACRHAGLNPFDLPLRNVGVYVGHNLGGPVGTDLVYSTEVERTAQLLHEIDDFREATGPQAEAIVREVVDQSRRQLPRRSPGGAPDCSTRLAAAIISESLGLSGPSMILDAACSSGLQGLAMAARSLQLGRIDMAIVAGASYYHVDGQIIFSKAQSASPRAVCCPFDADADGLVAGEGHVAIIVKTLERALADGDPIQCVIRGIGVSSDGRGKSLWAPRKEGQLLAIRRAYAGGLDIGRLQYVEAHATSTRVGDITELKALAEALEGQQTSGMKIALGAVKANIGHTLEAAGLASLVKTVLALKHRTIPKQIALRELNPGIDWTSAPFYVPSENAPWQEFEDGHPRRAGVNSFGIGGLNVHVVIDEWNHTSAHTVPRTSVPRKTAASVDEPIAIVGASCIFPGARTLAAFWDLIASGRDAKTDAPPDRWDIRVGYAPGPYQPWKSPVKRGGFVTDFEYDWRKHKIPPNQLSKADPLQLMILDATDAALADAGYERTPFDRSRTGVVVGTIFGGDFSTHLELGFRVPEFCDVLTRTLRAHSVPDEQIGRICKAYGKVLLQHFPALLDETGSFTPSTLASRITKMYDLMGGAVTIDAGQTSSLAAISTGIDAIQDGSCDMVICAAGDRAMGLFTFESMSKMGHLADEASPAPFDANAHGCLPGEGVGVVVLKRLSDAVRDGNSIRGIIRGVGTGFSTSRAESVRQAIRRAQEVAGKSSAEELLLETSGLGLADADGQEMSAVAEAVGNRSRDEQLVVNSLVGQIGHTQGASGMASLLAAVRGLQELSVARRANCTTPLSSFTAAGSPLRLATEDSQLKPHGDPADALAGVNSIDTFGSAYHLILQRGTRSPVAAEPTVTLDVPQAADSRRIIRIGSTSVEVVAEQASRAASDSERIFAAADSLSFREDETFRLAIVAENPADLAHKLALAAEHLGKPKAATLSRKDIFFGEVADPIGKIAFVFPGQGSQFPGMLKPLVERFPPAAEACRRIDGVLTAMGIPKFGEIAWEHPEKLGSDVWITQLSLLCADCILLHSLRSLGIEPSFVAGHSFGEFPALVAAGAWNFANAVQGTRARCEAITACSDVQGVMVSIAAPGDVVERICQETGGHVYPANFNAPDQTVVGGTEEAVVRLETQLASLKIACTRLAVPRPFHTPLMAAVKPTLTRGLSHVLLSAPRLPLISSVTNRPVTSGKDIRGNLVAQMTSPVRYVELVRHLSDLGANVIIEVGPHRILTGLNQKILADRNVISIASGDKSRDPVGQLLAIRACLESRGLLDTVPKTTAIDMFAEIKESVSHASPQSDATIPTPPRAAALVSAPSNGKKVATETPQPNSVPVLSGTPYEIGQQLGTKFGAQIRSIARRYADIAGIEWEGAGTADLSPFETFELECLTAEEQEEIRGLADAAGVSPRLVAVYNAWGDCCLAENASHVAVAADGNEGFHAFDEPVAMREPWGDLGLAQSLRVYRPESGLTHAVVGWPGIIGSSVGMNESGLAISSVSLQTVESHQPPANLRTLLVRRILAQAPDVASAVTLLCRADAGIEAEFCLSHSLSTQICVVRLHTDGQHETLYRDGVATLAEEQPLALVGSSVESLVGRSPWLRNSASPRIVPQEILSLQDDLEQGTALTPEQLHSAREWAETNLAVVLDPRRGEIHAGDRGPMGHEARTTYRFPIPKSLSDVPASTGGSKNAEPSEIPEIRLADYLAKTQSIGGKPPFDTHGRVCQRYVMRMLSVPVPAIDESLRNLNGPALIIGSNAVALELRKQIQALGRTAVVVPRSDNASKTLEAVDAIWKLHRPLHLFVVSPFDPDAKGDLSQASWESRRQRGVVLPFLICHRWFTHLTNEKLVEKASIVAATALGGDFGLRGSIANAESGALSGFLKSLIIEIGLATKWAFRTKIVDFPQTESPEHVAESVLRELRALVPFSEIGYCGGKRYVIGILPRPTVSNPQNAPTRGRPWLLTGGARGITAAIAHELGNHFGVKLHLVGASPRPTIDPAWRDLAPEGLKLLREQMVRQAVAEKKLPADKWRSVEKAIEIDKTLRSLEAAGVETVYHACDVSDRASMGRILADIRRTDGPLEGIIHGAGVEQSGRFLKKDAAGLSRTIAAKVDGAAILMDLTRDEPPRFFFGFGSISGRWGSIGQADYALASEMLAKLIDWYRVQNPECHATCFHWHPWADVGMAVREETRGGRMLEQMKLMPADEGVQQFIDELLAGAPEPEVIVTDWNYYKRFIPDLTREQVASIYQMQPWDAEALLQFTLRPAQSSPATSSTAPQSLPKTESKPAAAKEPAAPIPPAPATTDSPLPVVASRQVMRMVEVPRETVARTRFEFVGPALIVGDSEDARALGKCLEARGVPVHFLPIHSTNEETIRELEAIFAQQPVPHLFLMTGREPEAASFATAAAWPRRRQRGVMLPFVSCQRWLDLIVKADLLEQSSIVAATSLGGDFGFSHGVVAPEGGALTGLLKGIYMEVVKRRSSSLKLKIIDAPADEPAERLAIEILNELDVDGFDVEVAFSGGKRRVVRLLVQPVHPFSQKEISRGGTWVVTGGARGITAAVAKEIGRRFGLKLHLVGMSPRPNIDASLLNASEAELQDVKRSLVRKAMGEGVSPGTYWERLRKDLEIEGTLRDLAKAGVKATYHACDVANWTALETTLEQIRSIDGPIDGIIHGAGITGPSKALSATPPSLAHELIEVKVDAAVALMLLTMRDPVRYFVGFGSISGRFGTADAATYTLSNDMLCKLIGWYRTQRPGCQAVGFHWHPWGEVGMMTLPVAQHTIKIFKMKLMPPHEGAAHLIDELCAGAPESEVLITDFQFTETFYSKDMMIRDSSSPLAQEPERGALIERIVACEPGCRATAEIRLHPLEDPFLAGHRLRGRPTLPLVVALEAFAETARLVSTNGQTVVGFRDVDITDAVRFFTDEPTDIRLTAEMTENGVRCRLTHDFRNRRGQMVQKDRLHFSGAVELAERRTAIEAKSPQLPAELFEVVYPETDEGFYHGPPLRLLKRIKVSSTGAVGEIYLPSTNDLCDGRDALGWLIPSAALDACLYGCGIYCWAYHDQSIAVPQGIARLMLGRAPRPDEKTIVQLSCREMQQDFGLFDFTLFGDDGAVIFQTTGYRCHVLRGPIA